MSIPEPTLGKIQSPGRVRSADVRTRRFLNTADLLQALKLPRKYMPPTLSLLADGKVHWERERRNQKEARAEVFIKRAFPEAQIDAIFHRFRAQGDPEIEVVIFSVPVPKNEG